jgi:hypothetical protein
MNFFFVLDRHCVARLAIPVALIATFVLWRLPDPLVIHLSAAPGLLFAQSAAIDLEADTKRADAAHVKYADRDDKQSPGA